MHRYEWARAAEKVKQEVVWPIMLQQHLSVDLGEGRHLFAHQAFEQLIPLSAHFVEFHL